MHVSVKIDNDSDSVFTIAKSAGSTVTIILPWAAQSPCRQLSMVTKLSLPNYHVCGDSVGPIGPNRR